LSSRISLTLAESEADVDFPAAISFTQVLQTEGGRPMTI
jgi:hypothetical protein